MLAAVRLGNSMTKHGNLPFTLLSCLLVCLASNAEARVNHYDCTIEKVYRLDTLGLRQSDVLLGALEKAERRFHVDRKTGVIPGGLFENLEYDVTVVAPGDQGNSFEIYWVVSGTGNTSIRVLTVEEYVDGPLKPFHAVVQTWYYTGLCE